MSSLAWLGLKKVNKMAKKVTSKKVASNVMAW